MIIRSISIGMGIFAISCNTGKVILDKVYEDFDARFVSQVYTWECQITTDDVTEIFVGTYGHDMALYYAPGTLDDLVPSQGCAYGVDMFPTTAGANASSLAGLVGYPGWSNSVTDGSMEGGFGYWYQEVLTDERTCTSPAEILSDPIVLGNALGLSGASIDTAYDVPVVDFSSGITDMTFGDTASMEWESHDWPRTWVHIRRVQEGQPVELLTCVVEDGTEFEINEGIWSEFDEALPASDIEVYVAFEHREVQQLSSGETVEVLNRAVAVPVEN